jgi:Fe-S cluster assembly ATP-binding protein
MNGAQPPVLAVGNLKVSVGEKEIIRGLSLTVEAGKVTVVMGPNGSGKSTLTAAVMGNPDYTVEGDIVMDGQPVGSLPAEQRARKGLFLAFQSPIAVPGVSAVNLLRSALSSRGGKPLSAVEILKRIRETAAFLKLDEAFLSRGINDGFSGGERKKMEVLQALILEPKVAMFDEIDTGLDVDALKIVASGINKLTSGGTGVLVITHYNRILKYLSPDRVIVLVGGRVKEEGDRTLAERIEREGYARLGKA